MSLLWLFSLRRCGNLNDLSCFLEDIMALYISTARHQLLMPHGDDKAVEITFCIDSRLLVLVVDMISYLCICSGFMLLKVECFDVSASGRLHPHFKLAAQSAFSYQTSLSKRKL